MVDVRDSEDRPALDNGVAWSAVPEQLTCEFCGKEYLNFFGCTCDEHVQASNELAIIGD